MNKRELLDAIGGIGEPLIEAAETDAEARKLAAVLRKKRRRKVFISLAAAGVLLCVGIGGFRFGLIGRGGGAQANAAAEISVKKSGKKSIFKNERDGELYEADPNEPVNFYSNEEYFEDEEVGTINDDLSDETSGQKNSAEIREEDTEGDSDNRDSNGIDAETDSPSVTDEPFETKETELSSISCDFFSVSYETDSNGTDLILTLTFDENLMPDTLIGREIEMKVYGSGNISKVEPFYLEKIASDGDREGPYELNAEYGDEVNVKVLFTPEENFSTVLCFRFVPENGEKVTVKSVGGRVFLPLEGGTREIEFQGYEIGE